jgi:hypothetical protein
VRRWPEPRSESRAVTAFDWIAAVQALFLAAAAYLAWRSYRIAAEERRREPLRRLLLNVVDELMAWRSDIQSRAQHERLRIAVDVIPPDALGSDLPKTRQLAQEIPVMGSPIDEWVNTATRELAGELRKLLEVPRSSRLGL